MSIWLTLQGETIKDISYNSVLIRVAAVLFG